MQLLQVLKDNEYEEYKLCRDDGVWVVSFDVEIRGGGTALISYTTVEEYRNRGFASIGLQQLRDFLFAEHNILLLELIDLSGDYSRKVAENAGFFSPSHSLNYYVCLNPEGEKILDQQLEQLDNSTEQFKDKQRDYKKFKRLRSCEEMSKKEMRDNLEQLLNHFDDSWSDEYKEYIQSEISHIQRIVH